MRRLLPVLAAVAALVPPGTASAAACSPLTCAASQFSLGGDLVGYRAAVSKPVRVVDVTTGKVRWTLPAGLAGGSLLVHQSGRTLTWYDARRGAADGSAELPDAEYSLAGVSQDGERAVATRVAPAGMVVRVVSRNGAQSLTLPGRQWEFDALWGDNLFLIHPLQAGGYQVRLAHPGTGVLEPTPLKDPHRSAIIWGFPFRRLSSADGRSLFTVYIASDGSAMIHALDLAHAKARCIDLPGSGDYGDAITWTLSLAPDGRTLWAASPGYGRIVAIDLRTQRVTKALRLALPSWTAGGTSTGSALSPDGAVLALTDGASVARVDLATGRVVGRTRAHTLALAYSPAGRLWRLS
jgi:hypothetical protein